MMPQTSASPAPRDWLLLIGGSTYKFTLTGFYLVALVAILKAVFKQSVDLTFNRKPFLKWLSIFSIYFLLPDCA